MSSKSRCCPKSCPGLHYALTTRRVRPSATCCMHDDPLATWRWLSKSRGTFSRGGSLGVVGFWPAKKSGFALLALRWILRLATPWKLYDALVRRRRRDPYSWCL